MNAQAAPDGAGTDSPAVDQSFVGHYLTGQAGEGVFIEHVDSKAFLTFATYDGSGQNTWFVMPDGRLQQNVAASRSEFVGAVYRVRRGQESPPSLQVTPVGNATWFSSGPDTIQLTLTIYGNPMSRTLRRFR